MPSSLPIGFLDSGVGGLSVLNAARRALPHEHFILYGDSGNAPYGTKPEKEVVRLVSSAARELIKENVKTLVIACNTATSIALGALKKELSIPVIGILPAIKDAQALRRGGRVLVMATPNTVKSRAFAERLRESGEGVVPLGCPGLMDFVERGELSGESLRRRLQELLTKEYTENIGAVVLGCTHYPFLKDEIAKFFPDNTPMIDGSARAIDELKKALEQNDLMNPDAAPGRTVFRTSGGERTLALMHMLYRP